MIRWILGASAVGLAYLAVRKISRKPATVEDSDPVEDYDSEEVEGYQRSLNGSYEVFEQAYADWVEVLSVWPHFTRALGRLPAWPQPLFPNVIPNGVWGANTQEITEILQPIVGPFTGPSEGRVILDNLYREYDQNYPRSLLDLSWYNLGIKVAGQYARIRRLG